MMKSVWRHGTILQRRIKYKRQWNESRTLTTWSPLASVFNQRRKVVDIKRGVETESLIYGNVLIKLTEEFRLGYKMNFSLTESVYGPCTARQSVDNDIITVTIQGLFKNEHLTSSMAFHTFQFDAIEKGNRLVEEATSPNRTRPMVEIFDELSNTLCQVADLSEFIRIAHPRIEFRSAAESACIAISGLVEKLNTHKQLYKSLKASVEDGTSGDEHVCNLFLFDFEQCGIHLNTGPRDRVVDLNDRILQFGQRFANTASKAKEIPRYMLPKDVQNNFGSDPVIAISGLYFDCPSEKAREIAYRLYLEPITIQEITLCSLLSNRQELADLCGFKTYAERAIKASTMETAENVEIFLSRLSDNLRSRAQKDFDEMLTMKRKDTSSSQLHCWDSPYYTLQAKRDWMKASPSDYSPYFSLGACMDGFNKLIQELYGITLENEEMEPGESWFDDVYKLAVKDKSEGLLGYIYCDFYDRRNKPHQDCHFTIQGGKELPDGTYQLPIVVVMLSLANSSSWNAPPLLYPGAVDNLFHEMGHAIHSMLGRTKYQHVSGTRCPTDLAEVPSVLMENFAGDSRVLKLFARHFQTQECLPDEMIHRLCASKHIFGASEMQLQVFYSILDQKYHTKEFLNYQSTTDLLKDVQGEYYSLPYVENTAWQHRFSHLVGYGAKYYSYLISRAVAYSIFRKGFAADPLSRSSGEALRHSVLKHGGSKAPREVLSDYLQPENLTPESLADALTDELDHNNELIASFKSSMR